MGVVLDSNVLIAYLDREDIHHKASREAIRNSKEEFVISNISLAEGLIYKRSISYQHALLQLIRIAILTNRRIDVSTVIAFKAATLKSKYKIQLADALIAATSEAMNFELWTFDRNLAKKCEQSRYLLPGQAT